MYQSQLCVRNLPFIRGTTQLLNGFDGYKNAIHPWVNAGQTATISIDWQLPTRCDITIRDKLTPLAFSTKTQIFQKEDSVDGKSIIKLDYVDIRRPNFSHFISQPPRLRG